MSLSQVKEVIKNFVQNDQSDLLTIRGSWGVGKTFFWQDTIGQLSEQGVIKKEYYSYISLFGIPNLEDLKNSIFTSKVNSNVISRDGNTSASNLAAGIKQTFKDFEKIPIIKNYTGGLINSLAFQSIDNALICFDDIERKSDSLDLKEILGLASFLKEQKNCKIVFILNEGTLPEADKEKFLRYNEKVVDLTVTFNPLPEDVFDYVLDSDFPYFDLVKHSCLSLKIKNIRILQRIKYFINSILPSLENIELRLSEAVINSLILLVWSYYDKNSDNIIPLDFIEKFNSVNRIFRTKSDDKETAKQENIYYDILAEINYGHTEILDKEILFFVEHGYLTENFYSELEKKNKQLTMQKSIDSYQEAWRYYKSSFDINEQLFIEKLIKGFRENAEYLGYTDLYSVSDTLYIFGQADIAKLLIDEYLPKMMSFDQAVEFEYLPYRHEYKDPYFLEKVVQIAYIPEENFTLPEFYSRVQGEPLLYGKDITRLAAFSEQDYYDFIKSDSPSEPYFKVKNLMKLIDVDNSSQAEERKNIDDKLSNALKKIAAESPLNKRKVSGWFNINIE